MAVLGKQSQRLEQVNANRVTQVIDDWATKPFSSMTLRRYDCLSDEDYVFVKEWQGASQGCLINRDAGLFDYSLNDVVSRGTWDVKYRCVQTSSSPSK